MKTRRTHRAVLRFLFIALVVFPIGNAHAVFGTLVAIGGGSILIDQAADELDSAISKAETAAKSLIDYGDARAQIRLNQVNSIVESALVDVSLIREDFEKSVLKILNDANNKITILKDELMADLSQKIYEIECGARVLALEDARWALGGIVNFVGGHEIDISLPIQESVEGDEIKFLQRTADKFCFWCSHEKEENIFKIESPFAQTYVKIRDAMLTNIDENATLETPTFVISNTYDFIAALAKKTQCFSASRTAEESAEYIKFKSIATQYNDVLDIEVTFGE